MLGQAYDVPYSAHLSFIRCNYLNSVIYYNIDILGPDIHRGRPVQNTDVITLAGMSAEYVPYRKRSAVEQAQAKIGREQTLL